MANSEERMDYKLGERPVLLNHNSSNTDHIFNGEVRMATQWQQPSQSNFHNKLISHR
jgi:hypothetical protein